MTPPAEAHTTRGGLHELRGASSSLSCVIVVVLVASLPVVLSGAMATEMRSHIGFQERDLGVAVMGYYVAAAGLSIGAGRFADRVGSPRSASLAAALAAMACLSIAVADRIELVQIALVIGGVAIAVAQPTASAVIIEAVPFRRRGLAFGIKQSAIPAGTALAGLAVPAIALTVGWRWAFVAAAIVAACTAWIARHAVGSVATARPSQSGELTGSYAMLAALAVTASLAAAPALSLPVFLTSSATARDFSVGYAGLLLAVGSVIGLVARLIAGVRADRRTGNHLKPIGLLMALGSVGLFGMTSRDQFMFAASMLVAFAAGRAWQGLLAHAVTSRWSANPAAVTGITQTGSYVGGIFGPLAFGLVTSRWSDSVGWATLGAMMAAATLLVVLIRWRTDEPTQSDQFWF